MSEIAEKEEIKIPTIEIPDNHCKRVFCIHPDDKHNLTGQNGSYNHSCKYRGGNLSQCRCWKLLK